MGPEVRWLTLNGTSRAARVGASGQCPSGCTRRAAVRHPVRSKWLAGRSWLPDPDGFCHGRRGLELERRTDRVEVCFIYQVIGLSVYTLIY
jgi:hypothetical protein